jgi:hypothetical protein
MSIAENHKDFAEILRAAASERVKLGAILIAPWQIDAGQEGLDKGLDECGCAFCPDDDQKSL